MLACSLLGVAGLLAAAHMAEKMRFHGCKRPTAALTAMLTIWPLLILSPFDGRHDLTA